MKETTTAVARDIDRTNGKGKEKVTKSVGRPSRHRKPSMKGIGLYTNLNTRQ